MEVTMIDVLTGILVVVTSVYAYLTYSIASSNKAMVERVSEQIEQQTRPIITINIGVRSKVVFYLSIANRGASTAERLRLQIDRPFFRFAEKNEGSNISDLYLFQNEVATFASGDSFETDLTQGFNLNTEVDGENVTPDQFIITAAYSFGDRRYNENFHIDLRPYMGTRGPYTVSERLDEIRSLLEKKLP